MAVVIVKKTFKYLDKLGARLPFYISNLDTFLLKVLNKLSYNCKVNKSLVVRFLLNLLDYHISYTLVKIFNIFVLKT